MLKEPPGVTYIGVPHLGSTIDTANKKAAARRGRKRALITFWSCLYVGRAAKAVVLALLASATAALSCWVSWSIFLSRSATCPLRLFT
jgi:hypothetical protein